MTKKMKPPKKSRADLHREAAELRAQLASTYHFAIRDLGKAANRAGSGVMLTLTALGGQEIINPVLIRDGLSESTIIALQQDLARSYTDATALRPMGLKETVTVVCQNDFPSAVCRSERAAKDLGAAMQANDATIAIHLHTFPLT